MNKQLILPFLYLGAALLLGNCQREPEPSNELLNTRWMLKQVDVTPVSVSSYGLDYDLYIQFVGTGKQVRGLATCDALQGQFTLVTGTRQLNY